MYCVNYGIGLALEYKSVFLGSANHQCRLLVQTGVRLFISFALSGLVLLINTVEW